MSKADTTGLITAGGGLFSLEGGIAQGWIIPSSELLPKERIMKYYILINQKYGIDTEDGLRTYIHDMLEKAS